MTQQIWWYLTRSSAIVAWILLSATVIWGIVLSTDLFKRWRRPAWLLDLHRWLGGLMLVFVGIHIATLIADSYVEFSALDVLVPFSSDWKPVPVAIGIIAMWGLVAVQISSLLMKRLPRKVWRGIHLTSYVTFWLVSLHGTFAGTDASQPLYVATSAFAVLAVVAATTYRIVNGKKRSRRRTPPTRRSVNDGADFVDGTGVVAPATR